MSPRQAKTLSDLIYEGTFDSTNWRHRHLLEHDPQPLWVEDEVEGGMHAHIREFGPRHFEMGRAMLTAVEKYRMAGSRPGRVYWARRLETLVRGDDPKFPRPGHVE
jgi:hypothetical protein